MARNPLKIRRTVEGVLYPIMMNNICKMLANTHPNDFDNPNIVITVGLSSFGVTSCSRIGLIDTYRPIATP